MKLKGTSNIKVKISNLNYYLKFTIVFAIAAMLVFSTYIFHKHSFIWKVDGFKQHYKALIYYGRYLRGIAKNLYFNHKLIIPHWDFYIGEGSDVFNTFCYYVIGDPIALLSVFVPEVHMNYFYGFANIFRLYLAGVVFSKMTFELGHRGHLKICTGAISYSFCYWGLINAVRHPYFLNPLIYMPLLMIGVDRARKKDNYCVFIMAVALSAVSNIYFFYMLAILTAVYCLVRLFTEGNTLKNSVIFIFKLFLSAMTGMSIAAVTLLPMAMLLIQDKRVGIKRTFELLYPVSYYASLPSILIANNTLYWLYVCASAPIIAAVLLLFIQKKKEDKRLKILCGIAAITMLTPLGGRFLNGMSYVSNRWSWSVALLGSYILIEKWDDLLKINSEEEKKTKVFTLGLLASLLLLKNSRIESSFVMLSIFAVLILIITFDGFDAAKKSLFLSAMMIVSIISISFWEYSSDKNNYQSKVMDGSEISEKMNGSEADAIRLLNDEEYFRYTGNDLTENISMLKNVSATQFYWSIANPFVSDYRTDMEMREQSSYEYNGYDERTIPTELSGVKYYICKADGGDVPFGFEKFTDLLGYTVYKNKYYLGMSYTYDNILSQKTWDKMNTVQKEQSQLIAALTDNDETGLKYATDNGGDYKIDHEVECDGDSVSYVNNEVFVKKDDSYLTLKLEKTGVGENYIEFVGLDYKPAFQSLQEKLFDKEVTETDIKLVTSSGKVKSLLYKTASAQDVSGRHDFIVNIGYSSEPIEYVNIYFPEKGIYSLDEINVYNVPFDEYEDRVNSLKSCKLENMIIGNDEISGKIEAEQKKLLCMAIPYSKGWDAYVDNEKCELLKVNKRYIGVMIDKGSHEVRFKYHTPYQKAGLAVSCIGIVLLSVYSALLKFRHI